MLNFFNHFHQQNNVGQKEQPIIKSLAEESEKLRSCLQRGKELPASSKLKLEKTDPSEVTRCEK